MLWVKKQLNFHNWNCRVYLINVTSGFFHRDDDIGAFSYFTPWPIICNVVKDACKLATRLVLGFTKQLTLVIHQIPSEFGVLKLVQSLTLPLERNLGRLGELGLV